MDFTTTEASDDLGGLARTITESVCTPEHQRELDGLDERFDRDLWGKLIDADILSTAAPESLGGGGFGVLEQVGGAGGARPAARRGAVPGVGRARRGRAGEVRFRGAAAGVGGARRSTARRSSPSRSTARWARDPVQAPASGDGFKLTGTRTQVALRPGRRRVPGSRRNRFGDQGFPGRRRTTPGSR